MHECEVRMKKATIQIVLLTLLIPAMCSPVFAWQPYRPGAERNIDAKYQLKAIGDGRIVLTQINIRPRVGVLEVQGSGNSEYCVWRKYILIRVVPYEQNEDDEDNAGKRKIFMYPTEENNLSGQPYDYYIIERQSANVTGPLTKDEFLQRNEVGGYKVKWKFIETTKQEYRRGPYILCAILVMIVSVFVFVCLIALAIIFMLLRFFLRLCYKKWCTK